MGIMPHTKNRPMEVEVKWKAGKQNLTADNFLFEMINYNIS